MAITMKRQLNDEEKHIILKRHGRICFATATRSPTQKKSFCHIQATLGGRLNSITSRIVNTPTNRRNATLEDYRIKLRLADFFAKGIAYLRHLLGIERKR